MEATIGNQRLSVEQLQRWETMGYGMFVHFGMNTFEGVEIASGQVASTLYTPDKLDVDQWICVARDAGMKYAVLTTKHTAGYCLWPSKFTDYHVGTSGNKTDVLAEFVRACEKRGIMPGFYYNSWDNHNLFGSVTPSPKYNLDWAHAFTTAKYRDFETNQVREILTQYGKIGEVWIDIPILLPRDYRHDLYDMIASLQPETVIMMNNGVSDGSTLFVQNTWPTDLITIERFLPNSQTNHVKWREIEGKSYYIPGEVCDPIGKEWFFVEGDQPRSDAELLGMYLICRSRGTNLLLDVGPDKHGLIPQHYIDALMRLQKNIEKFNGFADFPGDRQHMGKL